MIRLKDGLHSNKTLPDRSSLSPKRGGNLIEEHPYQQAEPVMIEQNTFANAIKSDGFASKEVILKDN